MGKQFAVGISGGEGNSKEKEGSKGEITMLQNMKKFLIDQVK